MVLSVHCMYGDLTVQLNHIHTLSILVVTSGAQEVFICWFSINSWTIQTIICPLLS